MAVSSSDECVYMLSQLEENIPAKFLNKEWYYVNDQQNRNYNGQVTFEASALANSGRFLNWSEGVIVLPVLFGYKTENDTQAIDHGSFGVNLKNSFTTLIDSMEVIYGNTSVQQITPYSNIFNHFRMISTFSQDGVKKYGALLNFFPDTWEGYHYDAAPVAKTGVNGPGVSNNTLPFVASNYTGDSTYPVNLVNQGLLNRMYNLNFPVTKTDATAQQMVSWGWYTDYLSQIGKSRWLASGASGADTIWYVECLATIRLKDISNFCDQLGLIKGAFLKFTINYNSSVTTVTTAAKDDNNYELTSGAVSIQGRTNPLHIAGLQANSALLAAITENCKAAAATTIFGVNVYSLTLGPTTVNHSMLQSSRLYVPAYLLTPEAEAELLNNTPIKEIVYNDIYNYVVSNINANAQFSQLLSNGIVDPQYIVSVPILNGAKGNNCTNSATNPLLSPFCSEPCTTSPAAISNYNILLSGRAIYEQNINYGWEDYTTEITSINSLNGGQIVPTSGLITFDMWNSVYRYYVTDLSRSDSEDKFIPRSVQIQGQNLTSKIFDLYCFIVYSRKIKIRIEDGSIVQ